MRVGIICACDNELAPFLSVMDCDKVSERAKLKFYEGTINHIDVVALFSGVCKVNAAIAAQILIDTYETDAIINAGTAGGMNPDLKVYDSVISTEVAYHDVVSSILTEFHPYMDSQYFEADPKLLNLSRTAVNRVNDKGSVYWGRMVTGEAFIEEEGRQAIIERYNPLSVDMETASIAHVCYVNGIPFIAIRSITDTAEHKGSAYFEANREKASRIAMNLTVALLAELGDR